MEAKIMTTKGCDKFRDDSCVRNCCNTRAEKAYQAGIKKAVELLGKALDIIQWMSGSTDFSPEGTAYQGWLKAQPDIEEIRAKLKEWGVVKA